MFLLQRSLLAALKVTRSGRRCSRHRGAVAGSGRYPAPEALGNDGSPHRRPHGARSPNIDVHNDGSPRYRRVASTVRSCLLSRCCRWGKDGGVTAFTKDALSPRRVPPEVVPLPFDLTWSELGAVLSIHEVPADSSVVAVRRLELQGLRGKDRSTVLSVESGAVCIDLFVKVATTSERERHALLERAGVPVPRLLIVTDRDDQLVLVFECLDVIGVDLSDRTEVAELLCVVARLNAIDADAAEAPPLPAGRPEAEFTESVQQALHIVADLGFRHDVPVEPWLAAYSGSKRRAAAMPQAVTHGEFYFQHVGRRAGGPLVVLDHATVGWRPRFSDLCGIVAPIADGGNASESDIVGQYLERLQLLGVAIPSLADAMVELRWLRVLNAFQSLPWLTRTCTGLDVGRLHLEELLATLERDLFDLQALQ